MATAGLATFVAVGSVLADRGAVVEVLVVASDAAPGTSATALATSTLGVPADSVLLESLLQAGDLEPDLVLAHPVSAGTPLRRGDLVDREAAVLHRTATVAVESVSILGLGLSVGDRVDVVGLDGDERIHFVLTDVRVARLPEAPRGEGLLGGPTASFVTLEVDDTEALALVGALRRGPLEFVRSTGAPSVSRVERLVVEEAP